MSIGERLDKFAIEKYGDNYGYKSKFAKDLGIAKNTLSRYINNFLTPGNSLQNKLRAMGCDVDWVMTGERAEVKDNIDTQGQIDKDLYIQRLEQDLQDLRKDYDVIFNENLMYKREIAEMNKTVTKIQSEIIDLLREKIDLVGNEDSSTSSPPLSNLKKISVEV